MVVSFLRPDEKPTCTEALMKCLLVHGRHPTFRRLMLTFQGQALARASSGRTRKKSTFPAEKLAPLWQVAPMWLDSNLGRLVSRAAPRHEFGGECPFCHAIPPPPHLERSLPALAPLPQPRGAGVRAGPRALPPDAACAGIQRRVSISTWIPALRVRQPLVIPQPQPVSDGQQEI